MDTPTLPPLRSARRLRIALFLGLIVLVQSAFAYLLTWIDPPRAPLFVPIRITSCQQWQTPRRQGPVDFAAAALFSNVLKMDSDQRGIRAALDGLVTRGLHDPVIVYLNAVACQADAGSVFILPSDAALDDAATWLSLHEILRKLQACPAKHKLLILELTPPPALARTGHVYHDVAAALPRELDAVPDGDRLVLSACAAGQQPHDSTELGQSVFGHYFHEALRGHADGYGDLRDGHITVKELAAFVQARVERWSGRNRGARQTPTLHGTGSDFTLVSVDRTRQPAPVIAHAERRYPEALQSAWRQRDVLCQTSEFRMAPRAFQRQQAACYTAEKDCGAIAIPAANTAGEPVRTKASENARSTFNGLWREFEQQRSLRPADVERIKKRFVEEVRAKVPEAERDAVVFAHALAEPHRDPGFFRLCDQLLAPAPRSAEGLRLRLVADLAMRVEVQAWPRDAVHALLHSTDAGEKAQQETPYLPGYTALLDEAAQRRHAGEIGLWTRGFSSQDDALTGLAGSAGQLDRLLALNEKWRQCELVLDETLAELPWYLEALEALPELREPWQQTAAAARPLADALNATPDAKLSWQTRVAQLTDQLVYADKYLLALQQHRQALHAPFAKDALARLERHCCSPHADPTTRHVAEATLSVAGPILRAEERVALWNALQMLSRRSNEETLALDRQDDEAQRQTPHGEFKTPPLEEEARRAALRAQAHLALLELAGVPDERLVPLRQGLQRCQKNPANAAGWCELGAIIRRLTHKQMPLQFAQETRWRERERLAWLMPPLERFEEVDGPQLSPTAVQRRREKEQQERWQAEHLRYVARDYHGLNLESPGILAARSFYAQTGSKAAPEAYVQMSVAATVEPLTEKQPYAHLWLEVTRHVPAGAFGPVELQFPGTNDVWLEVSPGSATLPALVASKESRIVTHKVPLKAMRKPKAERTGLPPPIGFLVEARFGGRSYHHLVHVPIIPSTQELQILVSADPDEPNTTLNEIRVRPGKVKQAHYLYVKNLTNRTQKVHVEVKAGAAVLHKGQRLVTLEPDGVRKVLFDESPRSFELRGPLEVRVFDADRQKVIAEKSVRVEILAPHDYVKVAEATYEPGQLGNNKWAIQVEAVKQVPGPAIAAQLVLPVQRIPGLLGIGGGTLHVELPTQAKAPRTLFAENLHLVHSVQEEGPVYLHIDGVARAFVYRTTFARNGEPSQPVRDERPAVRIVAPPCVMAGINCLVDVEVDNAPAGVKLEVALGRLAMDGTFKTEVVREFTEARKRQIDLEATKDSLIFAAAIRDWTATFDTRSIVGARELRARLIDPRGKELASARQSVVIDDSPPIARIVVPSVQVKKGTVLQVKAEGADPESGVAQVLFFLGPPDKGEIPLTAPRFKAIPAGLDRTLWQAALLVPLEHRGPLVVSVQVVNHAGLTAIDTVTLDVTDTEPGKTGLGEIRGVVLEGQRPQANLLVTLCDETGKEIARTRTLADGAYAFLKLAPGQYRVVCVKPESQRRAVLNVIVGPDRTSKGDLALAL